MEYEYQLKKYIRKIIKELNNNITYTDIISNLDVVKDEKLTKKLLNLSHKQISGGIKAVWKHPKENLSKVVIAFDNKEPVGVITNTKGSQNIFVKPKYRNRGIGSKLKDILYKRN